MREVGTMTMNGMLGTLPLMDFNSEKLACGIPLIFTESSLFHEKELI